jgi:hypothetical protein
MHARAVEPRANVEPTLDRCAESLALCRLTGHEHGVQMEMRLHQSREEKATAQIYRRCIGAVESAYLCDDAVCQADVHDTPVDESRRAENHRFARSVTWIWQM